MLATQQETTLARELNEVQKEISRHSSSLQDNSYAEHQDGLSSPVADAAMRGIVRQRLFCHRSPTDSLLIAMGRWMDAAVPAVPNRYRGVLSADGAGA